MSFNRFSTRLLRSRSGFTLCTIVLSTIVCILFSQYLAVGQEERTAEFGSYEGYAGPQYEGVTTQSLYVTMRDGVKIAIDVMLPKNLPSDARIPAILKQTRYWRAMEYRPPLSWFQGPDEFERFFTSNGYALVFADVRGTGASYGTWINSWSRDEVMDGGEIVDWIIAQHWSNGKVGTIGISYPGTSAEFIAINGHPAIKAIIPQFADHDLYPDIAFPGGIPLEWFLKNWAYFNTYLDNNIVPKEAGLMGRLFVRGVKPVDADKNRHMLREAILQHANNGDVYKLATAITYRDDPDSATGLTIDEFSPHSYVKEIEESGVAVFSWGSWFDASQGDAVIRRFINYSNPQIAVIGPWSHGGGFHASPYLPPDTPTDPSREKQWLECLRFLDYHLKGIDNGVMDRKILHYYTVGEEKWKWTTEWPPAGNSTQTWYLASDNSLSMNPPTEEIGEDVYTIDFEATTGITNRWHTQMDGGDVIYPHRAEEDRRLLTYTSQPLTDDLEITGYPVVTLYVTSTHDDGAFFAYLEDVDETGQVRYIIEGQLRALHRKVSTEPPPYKIMVPFHSFRRKDGMPLLPGQITELTFGLHPVSAVIKKGHRIRIAIAGHDKDTFARIPGEGTPAITVARNSLHASRIDLPVIVRNK